MGELVCFQQCPQSINASSILIEFEQLGQKKKNEEEQKTKKQKIEQPWTLAYSLVLQTMSFPLSFYLVWTNWLSLQNDAM